MGFDCHFCDSEIESGIPRSIVVQSVVLYADERFDSRSLRPFINLFSILP